MNLFSFANAAAALAGAAFLFPSLASAAGNAGQPNICVRSCWGARAPTSSISQMAALTRAIVHHTAGNEFNTTSLEASKANVRAVQNLHIGNGWGDIGYHFLVDKFGNIFEGRSGAMSSLPRGAHDAANTNSFGFTCLGYFHPNVNNSPTAAMMNSLYSVIAWRMPSAWRPYGSPGGTYGNLGRTVGYVDSHRNVVATACPGDLLHNPYIGNNLNAGVIRAEILNRINGSSPAPTQFGAPARLTFPDGRIALFAVARGNGSIWHSWQTAPGSTFAPWVSMGGSGFSKVKAYFEPGTQKMVIYGIGPGSPLWQRWQLAVGGSWSEWASIGGALTDFDVVYGSNNLPFVFAVSAGAIWHNWQPSAGSAWNGWVSLGGSGHTQVQGVANAPGAGFTYYSCGPGSPLWQRWQTTSGGSWSTWMSLGGAIQSFEVVAASSGLPIAYAVGSDGAVHTNWQPSAGASWNGWMSLGGSGFTKIDALTLANGAGLVFGTGGSGEMWHTWQTAPGTSWSGWVSLGGSLDTISGAQQSNGGLLLFGHGLGNTNLWHRWQSTGGGAWSVWTSLGSGF